ncbi:hypothetical protein F511_26889 [Dorcoceras hygrometricum]|uniref:Dystroglycan-like n=1 Tax=Dorcoceras hygrometricum TaxID=472368 RepID=A0A2Z7ADH2_9LAMI|nr:hypothetical protein F511_26889 [Dorcoceras hygrometricum]
MASSLISNTNQVHFSSALAMDNAGMVAMFEALVASGLNGFLGCLSDIYEATLIEFYPIASVRDGQVISTVQGKSVEISEEDFARTFSLPVDSLTDINEVPKDLVFDAITEFSFTGEQLTTSCKKRELKIEFRILSNILDKSVTVKAGSFDAATHERFLMMIAINGGVKIIWSRLLFNNLKDMVTPGSRQARGYAVQISKTIHRYIAINDKIAVEDLEDVRDVSRGKKTPVKMAVSKKRPATAVAELVVKKKRTLKGKADPSKENLELDLLMRLRRKRQMLKNKEKNQLLMLVNKPTVATFVEKDKDTSGDDVDSIIQQILEDTAQLETDMGDTDETVVGGPTIQTSDDFISDDFQLVTSEYDRRIGVENDPDEERRTDDESMTLEEILSTIPAGYSLPSTTREVTKIQLGKSIQFRVVNEGDWYKASLPKISSAEKGKAPFHEKDQIKGNLTKEIFADIDLLVKLRERVIDEVLPQLSYVDTLPTVSELFKLLKKRWADVCLEAAEFFVSGTLLPVGSLNFFRALTVV